MKTTILHTETHRSTSSEPNVEEIPRSDVQPEIESKTFVIEASFPAIEDMVSKVQIERTEK